MKMSLFNIITRPSKTERTYCKNGFRNKILTNNKNKHSLLVQRGTHEHGYRQQPASVCERRNYRQKNILDLVFDSIPTSVRTCITIPGISDHDAVIIDLKTSMPYKRNHPRQVFLFNRANYEQINADMNEFEKRNVHTHKQQSVDENWTSFKNTLLKSISDNIPQNRNQHMATSPMDKCRNKKTYKEEKESI